MATTTELRALLAAATGDDGLPHLEFFPLTGKNETYCEPLALYPDGDYCAIFYGNLGLGHEANAIGKLTVAAVNSLPGLLDERDALIRKLRAHCNSGTSATVHAFAKELLKDMGEE